MRAERMAAIEEVYEFARKRWAVPAPSSPLARASQSRAHMKFFYSGLAGYSWSSRVHLKDLDDGMEMAWSDVSSQPYPHESKV